MGTTAINGWEWPDLTDPANGPANFQTALEDIEAVVSNTTLQTYTPAWTSDGSLQPGAAAQLFGHYRVDNGVCRLKLRLDAGASTSGGSGNLFLTLPVAGRAGVGFQLLPAKIYAATGGLYRGHCDVTAGSTVISVWFPVSASESRMAQWRNTDASTGAGTGVPLVPASFPITNGSNVDIQGSYFV